PPRCLQAGTDERVGVERHPEQADDGGGHDQADEQATDSQARVLHAASPTRRIRGSRTWYVMSTRKLITSTALTSSSTTAWTTTRSRWLTASSRRDPSPCMANTCSMMMAPTSTVASWSPTTVN